MTLEEPNALPPLAGAQHGAASILCVDDNRDVADALRAMLVRAGFEWKGWLESAQGLVEGVARTRPSLVLLDIDMPGPDPLAALAEVSRRFPATRALALSGHVRGSLIDRAIDAGAWGYLSKNDSQQDLIDAIRAVMRGEFALSPEARRAQETPR